MTSSNTSHLLPKKTLLSKAGRKALLEEASEGRYSAKLAETPAEVESALRLRYEVFSLELGAQSENDASGLEFDEYDAVCKHLIIADRTTGKTIGTYRLNSLEAADQFDHSNPQTLPGISR